MQEIGVAGAAVLGGDQAPAQQSSDTATAPHAEHVVTTRAELRAAFDGLEPGDTVLITDENAPYRIRDYLDVDVSGVTVIGRGTPPLVRVADGANCGGIRVGKHSHVENVTIEGYSHDGNPANQSLSDSGFGIASFDVGDITIRECYLTRTAPYHKHNRFNSGIQITDATRDYTLSDNTFFEIGDRAITAQGRFGYIAGNYSEAGFDRMVSVERGEDVVIAGNRLNGNAAGSMFGVGNVSSAPNRVLITGNIATGSHRRFVNGNGTAEPTRIHITDNIADGRDANRSALKIEAPAVTVANNHLVGYDYAGVRVAAPRTLITNNRIEGCGRAAVRLRPIADGGLPAENAGLDGSYRSVVQGNLLHNNARDEPGGAEVVVRANQCRVVNNNVTKLRDGRTCFDASGKGDTSVVAWNVVPAGAPLFAGAPPERAQGNIN